MTETIVFLVAMLLFASRHWILGIICLMWLL